MLLHNPKNITKLKYGHGQHDLTFGKESKAVYFGYPFIALHLKYVDLPVLQNNSVGKYERISWRFNVDNMNKAQNYLHTLYAKSKDDEAMIKLVKKLSSRSEKYNTTTWKDLLNRYNTHSFIVNRTKQIDNSMVTRLDYDSIDDSIFYNSI